MISESAFSMEETRAGSFPANRGQTRKARTI
jgi:hypothetical protein